MSGDDRQQKRNARARTFTAMAWMVASGIVFTLTNAILKAMGSQQSAYQTLAMMYAATILIFLPFVLHRGLHAYRPRNMKGLLLRGGLHWIATTLFMVALTHITLAETTAIGFTAPLFVMAGASLMLRERLPWDRALAALAGLGGVVFIVAPRLDSTGSVYSLLMLLATLVISAGYLLTKHLTTADQPWTIVLWQSIVVAVCSIPMAVVHWQPPTAQMWIAAPLAAALNTGGQYALAKAFAAADMSASQPVTYLSLIWACILGWVVFGDRVHETTLVGGAIIVIATAWLARREASR